MEKLAEIKEVIFEGWAGSVMMKADPQFTTDNLQDTSYGTYAGIPCKLGKIGDVPERDESKVLTVEELKELGIKYPEGKEYYREGDILYVRGNQEVSSILGI